MNDALARPNRDPRYEKWRWTTFGVTWLIYACLYLTRKSFAVAKVAFADDPTVTLTREEYGLIDVTYLSVYAIGQFVWGPLGDRFGPRRILLIGLAVSVCASVLSGFSHIFWAFAIFAAVQGVGQSTGWSNVSRAFSPWFSLRERGKMIGWWCTHYAVGAAVALPFAALMMTQCGSPKSEGMGFSGVAPGTEKTVALVSTPSATVDILALRNDDGTWSSAHTFSVSDLSHETTYTATTVGAENHYEAVQREAWLIKERFVGLHDSRTDEEGAAAVALAAEEFDSSWGRWLSTSVSFWPAGFWAPAALLTVVWVLVLLFLRNRPEDVGLPSIEEYHGEEESVITEGDKPEDEPEFSWKVVGKVMRVPGVWMLGLCYFSIKLTRYAFYFWGPLYVSESLGSGVFTSAMTAAALPIGGALGVILSGYLSDNLFQSRRIPVAVIGLLLTTGLMLLGLTGIASVPLMAVFFFFIGFFLFGPDVVISATAAIDFGTKKGAGTATGLINGVGSIGAIIGAWLPSRITTGDDWTQMFWVFIVGLMISAAIVAPMWNKKPSTAQKNADNG